MKKLIILLIAGLLISCGVSDTGTRYSPKPTYIGTPAPGLPGTTEPVTPVASEPLQEKQFLPVIQK